MNHTFFDSVNSIVGWHWNSYDVLGCVTHWMPLPEPPEATYND